MKYTRKKLITLTVNESGLKKKNSVKHHVDSYLDREYAAWKNNDFLSETLQEKQADNQLLFEYIRSIYEEYDIPDPLSVPVQTSSISCYPNTYSPQKQPASINKQSSRSSKYMTPKRRGSINSTSSLRKTQKKQFNFNNQETPHRKITSNNKTKLNQSLQQGEIGVGNSRIGKKMGIKNSLSSQINKNDTVVPEKQIPYFRVPNPIVTHFKESNPEEEVQKNYKYCLGCEEIILSVNIRPHEKKCKQFRMLYQMNLEQILQYIQDKIDNIGKAVGVKTNSLEDEDAQKIRVSSLAMGQQSREIKESGKVSIKFMQNYGQTLKIGEKWLIVLQQINKLRWFTMVRQKIRQKLDI